MHRHASTRDISWLLDLHYKKQLDLNSPYLRRSGSTREDKQFFLDTILEAIQAPEFPHKTINAAGGTTDHEVAESSERRRS